MLATIASSVLLAIVTQDQAALRASPKDGVWHSSPFFTPEQLRETPALQHLSSVNVDRRVRRR